MYSMSLNVAAMYIEGVNGLYFTLFCPLCYCFIVFQTNWTTTLQQKCHSLIGSNMSWQCSCAHLLSSMYTQVRLGMSNCTMPWITVYGESFSRSFCHVLSCWTMLYNVVSWMTGIFSYVVSFLMIKLKSSNNYASAGLHCLCRGRGWRRASLSSPSSNAGSNPRKKGEEGKVSKYNVGVNKI